MSRTHGRAATYTNGGCRCDECKAAMNALRLNRILRLQADPTLAKHGSASTYVNWGCRCDACRAAWTKKWLLGRDGRRLRLDKDPDLIEHGTMNGYYNWRCRCDECRAAAAAYKRTRRLETSGSQ